MFLFVGPTQQKVNKFEDSTIYIMSYIFSRNGCGVSSFGGSKLGSFWLKVNRFKRNFDIFQNRKMPSRQKNGLFLHILLMFKNVSIA